MRMALSLPLVLIGLILLPTAALPVGLALILAGWWVYERSGLRSDDGFIALLAVLGALGAGMVFLQYAWQAINRALS